MASTSTSGTKSKADDIDAHGGVAPPAPTSAPRSTEKPSCDVFINHRGKDVKSTVASILYDMLIQRKLSVFLDSEELEYGGYFPQGLLEAMNSALVHIAIFSENYAESPWCLEELSYMLKSGAPIIPIFYKVDPSDLRYGKGKYGKAFKEYEEKERYLERLEGWKTALNVVSYYKGEDIKSNEDEDRQLKDIVDSVLKKIKKYKPLTVADHPVGMEEIVKKFEMKTDLSAEGVQGVGIVGIWGMGGLGKTTLAKEIYNRKSSSFNWSSFVYNVRDGGLFKKQKKILKDIGFQGEIGEIESIEEGKEELSNRLRSVKVLIVLDDVDHVDQLDALLPAKDRLASGSFVIVTTREHSVLDSGRITCVYSMEALDILYARELFCWYAFEQVFPWDGFEKLVEKVVKACHGLPLSLKVIGRELWRESNKKCWKSLLFKIEKMLHADIQKTLKISYDTLDNEEKEMFLDAACFFIGEKVSLVIEIWDGLEWSGYIGLKKLVSKCLLQLDNEDFICMHDHIRDMGRSIAGKQSPYRIGLSKEIIYVQPQEENRIAIQGIIATPDRLVYYKDRDTVIAGMVSGSGEVDSHVWCSNGELKVKTNKGIWLLSPSLVELKYLVVSGDSFIQVMCEVSRELVWLRWFQIGQRNLPSELSLKRLSVLELYEDEEHHLEELWGDSDSEAPVLLRELIISGCSKFQGFPKSIRHLNHLKKIEIVPFNNITSLPDEFCFLRSLEHLVLEQGKMQSLPTDFGNLNNLRHLNFCRCVKLRRLPVSFKNLTHLEYLNLSYCSQLTFTAEDLDILENITKLEVFDLFCCIKVEELPRHIGNNVYLRKLDLEDTNLRELPDNIGQLSRLGNMRIENVLSTSLPTSLGSLSSLTELYIQQCPNLESLPESLGGLSSLKKLWIQNCPVLERVPDSLGDLSSLTELDIAECPNLESLPESLGGLSSLKKLWIQYCPVLERVPHSLGDLSSLTEILITDCHKLEHHGVKCLAKSIRQLSNLQSVTIEGSPISGSSLSFGSRNLKEIQVSETEVCRISCSEDCCPQLERLDISKNCCLEEIEALPRTLESISFIDCEKLKNIPSLAQLTSLRVFLLSGCCKIEKIEGIPTTLESITLFNCEMLKSIPSFAQSTSLRKFVLYGCCKIEKIEGTPRTLESITLFNCEMLKSIPSFAQSTSLREFVLYGCCKIEKIEGIENCTELTELSADTCWEVPGIESLERMQNLRKLKLRANKGAVIERCIQRIQKLPDEIDIIAQAVPDAASLVDSLRSRNVEIVHSIANQKIKSRPKLFKFYSSGEAFMICLVINCRSSQMTVEICNQRNELFVSPYFRLYIGDQGRWVWLGVLPPHSRHVFFGEEELYIRGEGECGEEEEVEKGLVVKGEKQAVLEAFRSLLPLFQS